MGFFQHKAINMSTSDIYTVATITSAEVRNQYEILSHDRYIAVMRILMYYVTPAVSLFGVVGNIFSIIVLSKHGFQKCSNIVLVSLAFTDMTFLVAFNSGPKILYEVATGEKGFHFSRNVSFLWFILYNVTNVLDYGMGYISLSMPMLITIERLVAVFLPLHFHQIITPRRTWTAIGLVYIFWYTIVIYMAFWFDFSYQIFSVGNSGNVTYSLGLMQRSALFHKNTEAIAVLTQMITYLGMNIPPLFTVIGCLAVGVKVKISSSNRRKNLTSSTSGGKATQSSDVRGMSRTTRMLLAVCGVYTVACMVLSLPNFIPEYVHYTMLQDAPSHFGSVMYQVMNIVICINSSCNFVVYVGLNKNFRDTYKDLFPCCRQKDTNQ